MRKLLLLIAVTCPALAANAATHDAGYGTFEVPAGFTVSGGHATDSYMGALTRASDGFTIMFDIGTMAGTHVSPLKAERYMSLQELTINGEHAWTAMERGDPFTVATTICDPCERARRFVEESRAIAALPREQREEKLRELNERRQPQDNQMWSPANFWARIGNERQLADFMRIVGSWKSTPATPVPAVIGNAPKVQPPETSFAWGTAVDGMSLGVWSEKSEYRLNNRINVWVSLRSAEGAPVDGALASESDVFVSTPRGGMTAFGFWPRVRVAGSGFTVELSDAMHTLIREPGTYSIQWKIGRPKAALVDGRPPPWRMESGTVTFTVVAD